MLNICSEKINLLPAGVSLQDLKMIEDNRGWLTEIYRQEWYSSYTAIQWNALMSKKKVLRGTHVHQHRVDYFIIPHGKAEIGLKDIRKNSPTYNLACTILLDAKKLQVLMIPPGIIHGFFFLEDSILLSGFDQYWNTKDEFGCQWDDVDLGIPWSTTQPILSHRDANSQSYKALLQSFTAIFNE